MNNAAPFFSIVMVTLNDENNFFKSMESLLQQTTADWEAIIVEGGSPSKRLLKYVNSSSGNIQFTSEKDFGIYDAMNKGIKLSTGKWVIFLNSGDKFFKDETLAFLKKFLRHKQPDVCYADVLLTGNIKPRRLRSQNPEYLKYGMTACHQGFVFNNYIFKDFRFDTKWQICSDYELMCRIYKNQINDWLFYDQVICTYLAGGFSDKNRLSRDIEEYKIAREHFGTNFTLVRKLLVRLIKSYVAQKINQFRRYMWKT